MNPIETPRHEKKDKEPNTIVPIIDLIRHGETKYRGLRERAFRVDPDAPGFALDAEHLDLTPEGIQSIRKTAEKLVQNIDKEKEIVLLIESDQLRALSSGLVLEDVFQSHNIPILNPRGKKSPLGLGQISPLDPDFANPWLDAHNQYTTDHPDKKDLPPAKLHKHVANEIFDKEPEELFDKSHTEITAAFQRYLRHLINIGEWLSPETRKLLEGKKLRIIVITHEERLMEFAKDALHLDRTVAKGQMIEVRPQGALRKDGAIETSVKLFEKEGEGDISSTVNIKYSGQGLNISKTE